jgi:flagellar motor protein MotB
MPAGCKKCDPHEICEECPEWIFTLADLIMCMMGLFVILWVLKPGLKEQTLENNDEWIKVAAAIRDAFGYLPDPTSNDPVDMHMLLKKLEHLQPPKGPGDGGKTKLERRGAEGTDPEVTSIRKGRQATVGGRLLFEPGSADITNETRRLLDEVAMIIRGHRNVVMVKGHASLDDTPRDMSAAEKMALSVKRAQTVADYLISRHVEPDILRVQGCGSYEPVAQRTYGQDSQAVNRRVEVEATATLVEDLQDKPEQPSIKMDESHPAPPKSAVETTAHH